MADERRYDDREVGLILKRVVELHEREGGKVDAHAMTTTEIEQVVSDLGLPTALVRQAVSDLAVSDIRNRPVWWLGGKTDLMFERVIDGTLDDGTLTRMVEVLRRYLADPGVLKTEGSTRIWSTARSSRHIHLTVVEHAGKTTIRLEERMPVDARTTVGGATMAGWFTGIMSAIPLKVLLGKSLLLLALGPTMAAGAAAGWLVGRAIWKRRGDGRERELRSAFGELLSLATATRPALPGD